MYTNIEFCAYHVSWWLYCWYAWVFVSIRWMRHYPMLYTRESTFRTHYWWSYDKISKRLWGFSGTNYRNHLKEVTIGRLNLTQTHKKQEQKANSWINEYRNSVLLMMCWCADYEGYNALYMLGSNVSFEDQLIYKFTFWVPGKFSLSFTLGHVKCTRKLVSQMTVF